MRGRAWGAVVGVALGALATPLVAQPAKDDERVAQNKSTILSRIKRDPVTYRGDKPGEVRVRWEWWDKVFNRYVYEKNALLRELSADEKYVMRELWAYRNMKVTFQEVFQLTAADDDKLIPIISHQGLLGMTPAATFEGLTLLGKHGEAKGPFKRKYKARFANLYNVWINTRLQYINEKGKPTDAGGLSYDAVTVRWRDIKDRVLDDVSLAKDREDAEMERDAQYPDDAAAAANAND
jgi:hypothetical protein